MKVFLHTRKPGPPGVDGWNNSDEEFEQVPRVGDHVFHRLGDGKLGMYLVTLVTWFPKSTGSTNRVEVYAVEVDELAALKEARLAGDAAAANKMPRQLEE